MTEAEKERLRELGMMKKDYMTLAQIFEYARA